MRGRGRVQRGWGGLLSRIRVRRSSLFVPVHVLPVTFCRSLVCNVRAVQFMTIAVLSTSKRRRLAKNDSGLRRPPSKPRRTSKSLRFFDTSPSSLFTTTYSSHFERHHGIRRLHHPCCPHRPREPPRARLLRRRVSRIRSALFHLASLPRALRFYDDCPFEGVSVLMSEIKTSKNDEITCILI